MKKKARVDSRVKSTLALFGSCLAVYLIFKIIRPGNFGSLSNLFSYFQQSLMPAVAGCGLYFIVVMGLFDFSIGANIVLSALVGVMVGNRTGYIGFISSILAVATILGLINGIVYVKCRIPSIIVTIGLMIIYECLGALLASGSVFTLSKNIGAFGRAPMNIIFAFISFLIAYYFMKCTRIGIYTNAIGSNEKSAENMGINVKKYKVIAFVLAGFFAGLMSVLTVSYGNAMSPSTNMESMSRSFTPLMGCFFALAFKNSINPIVSIIVGEFIITMIMSGLIVVGIPSTLQNLVIGVTLIVIILLTCKVERDAVVK